MEMLDMVRASAPDKFEILSVANESSELSGDYVVIKAKWTPGNVTFETTISGREFRTNKGAAFDALIRHRMNNGYRTRMIN